MTKSSSQANIAVEEVTGPMGQPWPQLNGVDEAKPRKRTDRRKRRPPLSTLIRAMQISEKETDRNADESTFFVDRAAISIPQSKWRLRPEGRGDREEGLTKTKKERDFYWSIMKSLAFGKRLIRISAPNWRRLDANPHRPSAIHRARRGSQSGPPA